MVRLGVILRQPFQGDFFWALEVAQSNHQGGAGTPWKPFWGRSFFGACRSRCLSFGDYNGGVKFKLRDFQRGDFETLWKLDQECFPEGIAYTRFELAAYMKRSGSFTVVAEAEMEILGFIVAEANRRGVGHIVTVDVSPATRRFGIASELLRVAENRLRAARCRLVRLESAVDNFIALAFYERHQYEVAKTLPHYYSTGLDALLLEKDLLSHAPESKLLT